MSWPLVRLADVCSKISDGTHQAPNWATSGVPFLFVSNVRNGSISFDTNKFVSEDEYQKLTKHSPIEAGDVLYTAVGSYGHSAVVPRGKTFVFQRHIAHIKPNRSLLDAAYLSQMLETPSVRQQADGVARGVAQKTVTLSSLREFQIHLPPLAEQRRIAAILDKADALRRKRKRAVYLLDSLARSIFLEMFGEPVRNSKRWPVQDFGSLVLNESARRVPVKSANRDRRKGPYPYYGASGIIDYVDDFLFEGRRLLIAEDGANLLSRSTPAAFFAEGKFWVNNHAHVLAESPSCNLMFLRSFIEAIDLAPYVTGSAQPKLNRANMDKIQVPTPPLDLQRAYQMRVEKVETLSTYVRQAMTKDDALFSSLQSRAFSSQL